MLNGNEEMVPLQPHIAISYLQELADFASGLADEAGPVAREFFAMDLEVEQKADLSPVTKADRTIEQIITTHIQSRYPAHGILGEEFGRKGETSNKDQVVWVIDPIDGTKSFISGVPLFGTLISVLYNGKPVIGVVDHPALGERWIGQSGQPTLRNGQVCKTRDCRKLTDAVLFTTSPDSFSSNELALFESISRQARLRRFGGDCFAYALLASGRVDVVLESSLQPYDFLSLVPVIEGAGGKITDWQGQPLTLESDGRVVAAATADLHEDILKQLTA